jgi:hypothetical protein
MEDPDYETLSPIFARLRDYLAQLVPGGQLPGRQHIDAPDLREFMPFINLVDVVRAEDGPRFRYRLVGTTQTDMAGRETTGRFIEEAVLPEFVERVNRNMREAVETRRPVYDRFPMPHPNRTFIDTERLYFPLAADGVNVDMLLVLHRYPGSYALSGDPWAS